MNQQEHKKAAEEKLARVAETEAQIQEAVDGGGLFLQAQAVGLEAAMTRWLTQAQIHATLATIPD